MTEFRTHGTFAVEFEAVDMDEAQDVQMDIMSSFMLVLEGRFDEASIGASTDVIGQHSNPNQLSLTDLEENQ